MCDSYLKEQLSPINKYLETIPKSLVANGIFSIDFSELG